MGTLQYSIFRYTPSLIAGEHINLAAIFYYKESNFREFYSISKWKRVSSFDDTVNVPLLKSLMFDMKNEIGTPIDNPYFDIEKFCAQYNSEFYFDQCESLCDISEDSLFDQIEFIKKLYFQFEYEPTKRPTCEEQKKFLYQLLRSKKIEYTRNASRKGVYSEEITYDYIFKNFGVVFFNFNSKQITGTILNKVKAWAWNVENSYLHLKLIALYDAEDESRADIQPAINILSKYAYQTINIHNGFSDVLKLLD